jgi:hypothetical protein
MGRKSNAQKAAELAATVELANLSDGSVEVDEDAQDPDELRALAELNAGSDVKWSIHRVSDMGGKRPGYCGALTTAELTLDRIATEWGIGKYKVRGTRSNGQFAGQSTITIAEAPKGLETKPAPVTGAAPTTMQDYILLMEAKDAQRSTNMKEWAAILAPIVAPLISNFVGNKGPTLQDLTATLVNMKQLNGGSESQLSKIEELAKLVEVVQGIGGDGGKGSSWADIVRDGIKTVGDVLPALATRIPGFMPPPAAPALTPPAPVVVSHNSPPAPGPRPQAAPKPSGDPMLQLLGWLKEQCAGLAHQASLNKDPNLYADVVLDNLPDVDPTMLRNMLGAPDWWATLCQFSPNVQPYPQWFAECREALLKGLDEMIGSVAPPKGHSMPSDTDSTDE